MGAHPHPLHYVSNAEALQSPHLASIYFIQQVLLSGLSIQRHLHWKFHTLVFHKFRPLCRQWALKLRIELVHWWSVISLNWMVKLKSTWPSIYGHGHSSSRDEGLVLLTLGWRYEGKTNPCTFSKLSCCDVMYKFSGIKLNKDHTEQWPHS